MNEKDHDINHLYMVHKINWRKLEFDGKKRTVYDDSRPQQEPMINYLHNEME